MSYPINMLTVERAMWGPSRKNEPTSRTWTIIDLSHGPVILNGWSVSQVAAYERRCLKLRRRPR